MAIAVLVLWALTASAGLRLLFTSGLGRPRPAEAAPTQVKEPAKVAEPARVTGPAEALESVAAGAPGVPRAPLSKREARHAWDTPELERSRTQSVGGLRDAIEFMHPACAIIGLAFWMGYTLVHNRALAWIAFGLAAVTAGAGLAWFWSSRKNGLFSARLIAIHGGGAAFTFVLAALTALTARG